MSEPNSTSGSTLELGPLTGIVAVCLCGVFAFLDLYATQPLLPLLEQIFHASKTEVGLTVSASTLGVAISAPFVGIFAERLNRKRVIVASIAALSVPTLLAGSASGLHVLIFWRFLQGLIMPGIFATTIAYVTEEWHGRAVALVMSIYISGTVLGGFIGRLGGGLFAAYFSWRYSFVFLGLLTLAGTGVIARWLPHQQPRASGPSGRHPDRQFRRMLKSFTDPHLLATFTVGFSVLFTLVGVFSYIVFYLADPPFFLTTRALSYLFVVYLAGFVVTPGAGYLLGHIGLRRGLVAAICVSMAGVGCTLIHSLAMVVVGLALVSTGVFVSQSAATSYLREIAPEGGRVAAAGLYLSCYYLGGTAGGVLPSYVWPHGRWPACAALIVSLQLITLAVAKVGWGAVRRSPSPVAA